MTPARRLSRKEYLDFEEGVSSTPEGRAFLRQRDAQSRLVAVDQLRRVIREFARPQLRANGEIPATDEVRILRKELQEISSHIEQTRQEIASLRPDQTSNSRIVLAATELDSIVSATERATYEILNGAERIQAASARLPRSPEVAPIAAEIGNQAIEIMTACSFQDLTGQRTTKVVNALRYIETRINAMIAIWGGGNRSASAAAHGQDERPDAHLLNGPQREAADQSEIDSLFESAPTPAVDQSAIDALFK